MAPRSRVKHSITEPLHCLFLVILTISVSGKDKNTHNFLFTEKVSYYLMYLYSIFNYMSSLGIYIFTTCGALVNYATAVIHFPFRLLIVA